MKKVLVIGSINIDYSVRTKNVPQAGETIIGEEFIKSPGGKGANQAYALGKCGAITSMIGAVGGDEEGKLIINNLKSVQVNTDGIKVIRNARTGHAFITVDENGENRIIVIPGANSFVTKELIDEKIEIIKESDIIVMQLEIPLETVKYVIKLAKKLNKTIIIDPAPATKNFLREVAQDIDYAKPNETELSILTGMKTKTEKDIIKAAQYLNKKGIKNVLVTLGAKGSILVNNKEIKKFESPKVKIVDTTAAGDTFLAVFASSLSRNFTVDESIINASNMASFVCTRKGAQSSMPTKDETYEILNKGKEKIIIDTDPGIDDFAGIMLAIKAKKFNILGITTVAGNCSLKDATDNALKTLELANEQKIPVYAGKKISLLALSSYASNVHGENGFAGVTYKKSKQKKESMKAWDYLIKEVTDHPNEITIVAMGPLTNIAVACIKNPNFSKYLKKLIIMGGSEYTGNVLPESEFNFYKDPHAVSVIVHSQIKDIEIIDLDITKRITINSSLEKYLEKKKDDELAQFWYKITRSGARYDRIHAKTDGSIINDPLTIVRLLNPNLIKMKTVDIQVSHKPSSYGKTTISASTNPRIKISCDIKSKEVTKLIFTSIFKDDKEELNEIIDDYYKKNKEA